MQTKQLAVVETDQGYVIRHATSGLAQIAKDSYASTAMRSNDCRRCLGLRQKTPGRIESHALREAPIVKHEQI